MNRSAGFLTAFLIGGTSALAQVGLPILSQPIPNQTVNRGVVQIDLRNHFGVFGVTGQVVQFSTVAGKVNVELRAPEAPRNVANFLTYVGKQAYDNTFIHRVDNLGTTVPAALHGGFYPVATIPPLPAPIEQGAPVAGEPGLAPVRGTLAAYHPPGAGATSEWFFNVIDNSNVFGRTPDNTFTTFGRVLGNGMSVIDAIAELPRVSLPGTPLNQLPARNFTSGQNQLTGANLAVVSSVRVVPIYPPAVGDPSAVLSFSVVQSAQGAGIVSATVSGSTLTITPLSEGTVTLSVRAVDSNGTSAVPTTFSVTVPPGSVLPPSFRAQPVSQTVAAGTTVVFDAAAAGGESGVFPLRYEWTFNGTPIPGATGPILVLRKVTPSDAGAYRAIATNAIGSALSTEARLDVVQADATQSGRLVNLAIRTEAGVGDETLIVGFAVGGPGTSGSKPLLVRGVGPGLAQFGVSAVLADPILTLFNNRAMVAENDNWDGAAQIAVRSSQVGAFALPSTGSLDAAMALESTPGAYTLQIKGRDDGTGIALAEIYDATQGSSFTDLTPRLVNASARATASRNTPLISGFVVAGTLPTTVLIRAIGPTLGAFGVGGALQDPILQLFNNTTLVRENDDWEGDSQLAAAASAVGAFALPDGTSKDSMLLVTLPPGAYTTMVTGAGSSAGVALVEIYEIR